MLQIVIDNFAPLWDTSFSAAIFDRRLLVSWGKLWYNHRTIPWMEDSNMKIVIVTGSAHRHGTTAALTD